MKENASPLRYTILETPLIISNYVKGDDACNYEKYLVEFINASSWFQKNYQTPFSLMQNQSQGQCDAYSNNYGLDFKLIASKTLLQAKSIHSEQIVILENGVYAHCAPKRTGTMQFTKFPQAIRNHSIDELLEIKRNATKRQGIDNDIAEYLDTLETNKNVLLFFPFRFSYENEGDSTDDILNIIEECNKDYSVSLVYRYRKYPLLDTFFSFFYDYSYVICKWFKDHLVYLDSVSVEKSDTFMHLALTYCEEWSEPYDIILQMLREGKNGEEIDRLLSEDE